MNTERKRERLKFLYILLFSSFIFLLLFLFSFLRIRVVDLSYNIELGSLYIKLHLCMNLKENLKYLWKTFFLMF